MMDLIGVTKDGVEVYVTELDPNPPYYPEAEYEVWAGRLLGVSEIIGIFSDEFVAIVAARVYIEQHGGTLR